MSQKQAALPENFPSNGLLKMLADVQLANGETTRKDLRLRNPHDFQIQVGEVLVSTIQAAIHVAKREGRLANIPLSCDDGDMFTTSFATRLIKALTSIVGAIPYGKDDAILLALYQELAPIGARHEMICGNYAFSYRNDKYM
ncbi:MAG: hypothetical protein WCG73_02910, partial [Candidatus Moraniibacteriota bacterium]